MQSVEIRRNPAKSGEIRRNPCAVHPSPSEIQRSPTRDGAGRGKATGDHALVRRPDREPSPSPERMGPSGAEVATEPPQPAGRAEPRAAPEHEQHLSRAAPPQDESRRSAQEVHDIGINKHQCVATTFL